MSQITFRVLAGGTPVADVLLSSTGGPGPWQGMTTADGTFVADLDRSRYLVTFSKDGYVPQPITFDVKKNQLFTVTLVPAAAVQGPDPQIAVLTAQVQTLTEQIAAGHVLIGQLQGQVADEAQTIVDLRAQIAALTAQLTVGTDPVFVGWGTRDHAVVDP